jgi:hypothetical protein
MQDALARLRDGKPVEHRLSFAELRELVGFDAYDREAERYAVEE